MKKLLLIAAMAVGLVMFAAGCGEGEPQADTDEEMLEEVDRLRESGETAPAEEAGIGEAPPADTPRGRP